MNNKFNPFTLPYHPVQFLLVLVMVLMTLPLWIATAIFDGGTRLRGWFSILADMPEALKLTVGIK